MMELAALADAAVSATLPYFAKIFDATTEKIGEDALGGAAKLVGWLGAKLSPAGKEVLDDLAKHPSDELTQDTLKLQIQILLRDHPKLVDELQSLVLAAPPPPKNQTLIVSGDGSAKGVQATGNQSIDPVDPWPRR